MPERMAYLEKKIGDSADKHAKELQNLKAAHDNHAKSVADSHEKHSSVDDIMIWLDACADMNKAKQGSLSLSLFLCVSLSLYIYIYTHVYLSLDISLSLHICMYVCMYIYIYIY